MNKRNIFKLRQGLSKKKISIIFSFLMFLVLVTILSPSAIAISSSDVTVPGQNLQRTYFSEGSATNTSNLLWKFHLNGPPSEFACIIVDGVVYQGCLGTGDVYAINETTGTQIWRNSLNNTANSLTYYNGLIYTQGGSLPYDPNFREFGDEWIALDAKTGNIVWIYKIPPNEWMNPTTGTYGNPPIIVDGKMYITVYNGIATLDASTGKEIDRWNVVARSFFNAYSNGIIYGVEVNETDGKFYAFGGNPSTKSLNWISKDNPGSPFGFSSVGFGMFSGVALSDDLFVGEYNFTADNTTPNHVYRINSNDGAIKWVFPIVGYVTNNIAVAYNKVYAATSAGNVYAVSKTEGTSAVWTKTFGPIYAPIVVADQKLFFGSEDTYVYALDAFTGDLIWKYRTGDGIISSPVVANGNLFIASRDQYLYAFGPAPPKQTTTITLSVPQNVASGQALTVRGQLKDASGSPVVLASVTFQQRIIPRIDWTNVTVMTTDANGNYSYNWTPTIDGNYDINVVYNGDGLAPSAMTGAIKVGSAESVTDAIINLQNTILTYLVIILVVALIGVVLSALALVQGRKKRQLS